MYKLALIGAGGLLGTLCRYWFSQWVDGKLQSSFPGGTLTVNLVGCFLAGFLFQLFERAGVAPEVRMAVFTGFLGGFTTFSAYGLQTLLLVRGSMPTLAAINVVASNVAGLACVWAGFGISQSLFER
jgi:fluoride exporter